MKTVKGIPEYDYNRLVELIGEEKAHDFIERNKRNVDAVIHKIYREEFKLFIKSLPSDTIKLFVVLVLLTILIFYFFTYSGYSL